MRIIGISGSLRRGSFNSALLRAAARHVPDGVEVAIVSIAEIPLYDGDLEQSQGLPTVVREIKELIASADGLLLVSPEYNGSMPGVLKNAIDWLSRPPSDIARVFAGKPVALMGATPGMSATAFAQRSWLPVLRTLRLQLWAGGTVGLRRVHESIEDGELKGDDALDTVRKAVAGFVEFAATLQR